MARRKPPIQAVKLEPLTLDMLDQLRDEVNQDYKDGKGSSAAIGEPVGRPGRGQRFRVLPDGTKVSTGEIIDQVRVLLLNNYPGEVRRILVKQFGGSGRSFSRHISVARERNRKLAEKSLLDAKADSIFQRSKGIQDIAAMRIVALREMQKLQRQINTIQELIDSEAYVNKEELESLLEKRKDATERYDGAMSRFAFFDGRIDRNQSTLDRVLGTYAPLQIETKNSTTLTTDTPAEPLTAAEGDSDLLAILAKVKARVAEKTAAEVRAEVHENVGKPSEN